MDLPARPDSLHNLLPQIASFAEMQRVWLICLLRQKPLAEIFAVAGFSVLETYYVESFGIACYCACSFELGNQFGLLGREHKESEASCRIQARHQPCAP